MKTKPLFILAGIGILAGLISVFVYSEKAKTLSPVAVSYNPYIKGVYANGIIESYQNTGENINIYPEVSGRVTAVFTNDGHILKKGDPILAIDDSVQREIVAKDKAQADAALSMLEELKAQPRKENLDVAKAQLDYAEANLKNVQDQLVKIQKSYHLDVQSISKNVLDNAINAVKIGKENLNVAKAQYDLVKAGAWIYDIKNQENQYFALVRTYQSDLALLNKYIIRASIDGIVLRVGAAIGGYISPLGNYGTYTQNMEPVAVMGILNPYMEVRCYVDEILVPKLPDGAKIEATMFIRGENNKSVPLEFVRIQPYTVPKVELSDARTERVDVRVLPIIFKFKKPADINIFPGQLVDIYIRSKK